jgi:hypothetical protein
MVDSKQIARAQYLAWLRSSFPELYDAATMNVRPPGAGLGDDTSSGGFFDSLGSAFNNVVTNVTQALPQLANTYAAYENQQNLIRLNSQRANQGLSPLTYNAQGQLMAGGIPYTSSDLRLAGSGLSLTTLLLIGGGAIGLIFLLKNR